MTPPFVRRFRVRHYEVDALGHLHDFVYVQYMQEAAIEASTALGFSPEWYRTHAALWIIRRLSVRYYAQLTYGDEVHVATWISGMRGVRSTREYELTRTDDGMRVARGRAEWVYIDATTGQPARIPDEWARTFPAPRTLVDLRVRLRNPHRTDDAIRYTARRRVAFHELDTVQHVNHANYVRWCGEACQDAFRAAGYPVERARQEGWTMRPASFEVQYFAPALDNDNVETVSWVAETTKLRAAWMHEISNADTHKLLARAYALGVFINLANRPTPPPLRAVTAIHRGS
jgi:acyl-CoA thioester hydrolase